MLSIKIIQKYAFKAVKALFANVNPSKVYVGTAPDKLNDAPFLAGHSTEQEGVWFDSDHYSEEARA